MKANALNGVKIIQDTSLDVNTFTDHNQIGVATDILMKLPKQMVENIILAGSKSKNHLLVPVKMGSAERVTVVIKTPMLFVHMIIMPTCIQAPVTAGALNKRESRVVNLSGDKATMVVTLTTRMLVMEVAQLDTTVGLHRREEIFRQETASC